ncbi:MAG: hypothetical protein J6T74_00185 [Clostridia bacterium]|nr:hypothetical protein [Clostridia bacterium]
MGNSVYNKVEYVFTDEGKECIFKQNNGMKYSIVGAILFSDKYNWVRGKYNRKHVKIVDGEEVVTDKNYLHTITWKTLQANTQVIFKNVQYEYRGGYYVPNETQYTNASNNVLSHLIQVQEAFSTTKNMDGSPIHYVSYDVIIKKNTLNLLNLENIDFEFDGLALIGVPYKNDITDLYHPLIDYQDYSIVAISYFPDEKIKVLHNQNKKLAFNVELHLYLQKDKGIELVKWDEETQKYVPDEEAKDLYHCLHFVNDGTSNKTNENIKSLGGTTKLLIW